MNTTLTKMMRAAEGRYLTEAEAHQVRTWALGMTSRFDLAERLANASNAIVSAVCNPDAGSNGVHEGGLPRAEATEATELTLAYMANAVIRDDPAFFRTAFVEWYVDVATTVNGKKALDTFTHKLRRALVAHLEPQEIRALQVYLEALEEAVAS
jgi:hypothetical protein